MIDRDSIVTQFEDMTGSLERYICENDKLIAQLLEACEGILTLFEEGCSLTTKEVDQRIIDVEAAIAAAKGES